MNISRKAVLDILFECLRQIDDGYCQHGCCDKVRGAISQIENIPEAPGMDSALRRAQEKNWGAMDNHGKTVERPDKTIYGRECQGHFRQPKGGALQCKAPARHVYTDAERHNFYFCEACHNLNKEFTIDGVCYVEPKY